MLIYFTELTFNYTNVLMSYSVTNSDINPNSRGEQGGGLEKKTSQTFAPRLDFFEL